MDYIEIAAPAKVNLFLDIGPKREDGFHGLFTVMHKIALCDRIAIRLGRGRIEIECSQPGVPADASNTAWKAAELFFRETGESGSGCRIEIEKNIPAQGGLGGGSSDAAAVLCGLNSLCGQPLPAGALLRLGAEVGSDVPFFVQKQTTALCSGRGELIERSMDTRDLDFVLVFPSFGVSTAKAYALADSAPPDADRPDRDSVLGALIDKNISITHLCQQLYNRFESVLRSEYPETGLIQAALKKAGCPGALLSGSGSTVFGIVRDPADAESVKNRMLSLGFDARYVSTFRGAQTKEQANSEGSSRHGNYRNQGTPEGQREE